MTRLVRRLARRLAIPALLSLAALPLAAATPPPVERDLLDRLRLEIEREAAALDGIAGVFVEDLTSGATIALAADQLFPQASAIKLPILWELLARADEGTIDLDRRAPRPVAAGMGGILDNLSPAVELSARDLAVLMIAASDNGATNELIDRLGMERVTARMASLGLGETRLRRKMLDGEGARSGRENVSTPRQMAALAARLHRGEGLSAAGHAEARRLLGIWSSDPFRAGVGEGAAAVFEKPGELPGVRTSVAWVELPGRAYAVAISTAALAADVDGDAFVTRLSRAIYRTFDRLARMNEVGRFVD